MEIRIMKPEDYDKVYGLWMACAGMGINNLEDTREGIERFLKRNPDTCFAAFEDGRAVGAILAGNDGRRGYIYHMAVHPDFRRKGLGGDLVAHAVEALKGCGINKAALVVYSDNEAGNAFWERMGFTVRTDLTYRNLAFREIKRVSI